VSGLTRRVPTAIAYGALVLVPLTAGHPWFVGVIALLAVLGYVELVLLFAGRPAGPSIAGLILVGVFMAPRLFVGRDATLDIAILLAGVVGGAIGIATIRSIPALAKLGFTVAGAVYLGWLFGYLADLARAGSFHTHGGLPETFPTWLLLALIPTWAGDIAAYGVGSLFGQRKLAPRISPGKTWEGTLAGLAAAGAAVLAIATYAGIPTTSAAVAAVALGPAALGGDLFESYLKRRAGAKDSGTILPGHGGILDRIDSLIVVAPVTVIALFLGGSLG